MLEKLDEKDWRRPIKKEQLENERKEVKRKLRAMQRPFDPVLTNLQMHSGGANFSRTQTIRGMANSLDRVSKKRPSIMENTDIAEVKWSAMPGRHP